MLILLVSGPTLRTVACVIKRILQWGIYWGYSTINTIVNIIHYFARSLFYCFALSSLTSGTQRCIQSQQTNNPSACIPSSSPVHLDMWCSSSLTLISENSTCTWSPNINNPNRFLKESWPVSELPLFPNIQTDSESQETFSVYTSFCLFCKTLD